MNKIFYIIVFFLCLYGTAYADTHTSDSCSLAHVSAAITAADVDDTVQIADGNCTWTSTLTITKGIILRGGTGTLTRTGGFLIQYTPSDPSANEAFRVTNITASVGGFVYFRLNSANGTAKMTKIRVDNNTVTSSGNMIDTVNGNFYGVIDNNNFTIGSHMDIYGAGCTNWLGNTFSFGTGDNLYFEDNVMTYNSYDLINSLGLGGRVAFRYNTIVNSSDRQFYGWDIHGNQGTSHTCGSKGGEYYGNTVSNDPYSTRGIKAMDHRDGRVLLFFNLFGTSSVWTTSRNECDDDQNPAGYTVDNSGMPMHLNDSYYFINKRTSGADMAYGPGYISNSSTQNCTQGEYTIAENQDFWGYKSTFNGTSGVGCGTLGNRPTTCTAGVAYWATTQSCSDLTDHVGADPTTPIAGTLYKCTSNNVWSAYYTPYTYPHPLRTEDEPPADTTPPAFSSASIVGNVLTINLLEPVTVNDNTGFNLSCSGAGDEDLTFTSASGSTLIYEIDRAIAQEEGNCTLAYTTVANGIEDAAGNDLGSFSDATVVNNTDPAPPEVTLTLTITGAGCRVISSPEGINTKASTTFDFSTDTAVTLAQGAVENGWIWSGFGGDCASNGTVTMSAAKTCTAVCKEKKVLNWSR